MEIKLWEHQRLAIEKAKELDYYALFFQVGTGKTATCINILREKYSKHKKLLPTLVIAPPVVVFNWKSEILRYSKIKAEKIVPLVGTGKDRLKLLRESDPCSIFVTNFETLNMIEVFEALKTMLRNTPSCLVIDESQKIKDITAKRTKRSIELGDIASYRYILTGTPILNDLMDIYSQFRVLDRGQTFGHNFFTFRARFFEDKNKSMPANKYFPLWQPIRGADRKIKELIEPMSMYVEKSQCLSLPPLVKKVIEVHMSKEQQRLYDSMKKDLVATITTSDGQDRHSIAELAITKALRLMQIVSGHIRIEGQDGEETKTVRIKDNPRKDALRDLLEDIAPYEKCLVWAVYRSNYEDIREVCTKLGLKYVELNGETKDKDAEAHKFRTDPEVRVLIGNPMSAGIGINLVEASCMIYYSRTFSLEADLQSEARCFRGGSEQHQKITRIDLVTPASLDELVVKCLASKQELSDKVLKQKLGEI